MTHVASDRLQALVATHLGADFALDEQSGVWASTTVPTIAYPTDAFARESLGGILASASDLSADSMELEAHGRHWPSSYYLSPRRTNVLRAFNWRPEGVALEVGAGCGTITRYLAEQFEQVIAIEGDPLRAARAAARVRDLDNVAIVCASYDQLAPAAPVDFVFCVGVLEYAPIYSSDPDPFGAVTERFADFLRPDGALVVAIENQLGLKYLAGAAEDHSGIRFDGVEGYRRSTHRSAQTLGRAALDQLLADAGFGSRRFFYPFPDYKFARSLVADVPRDIASRLGELITAVPAGDYLDGTSGLVFDSDAAWQRALENGLLGDLANSFLVIAEKQPQSDLRVEANWDAVAFNMSPRDRAYWTRTDFVNGHGGGEVRKRRLAPALPTDPRLAILDEYVEPWHAGPTLAGPVDQGLHTSEVSPRTIADSLRPWAQWVRAQAVDGLLPGALFDAIPRNLTIVNGQPHLFDRELKLTEPVPVELVILRGIHYTLLEPIRHLRLSSALRFRGLALVTRDVALGLGSPSPVRDLFRLLRLEETVQGALGVPTRPRAWQVARMVFIGTPVDFAVRAMPRAKRHARIVVRELRQRRVARRPSSPDRAPT